MLKYTKDKAPSKVLYEELCLAFQQTSTVIINEYHELATPLLRAKHGREPLVHRGSSAYLSVQIVSIVCRRSSSMLTICSQELRNP